MLIAASLLDEQRDYLRKTFKAPEDLSVLVVAPVSELQPVRSDAYDCHFHLDQTLCQLRLSPNRSLEDNLSSG